MDTCKKETGNNILNILQTYDKKMILKKQKSEELHTIDIMKDNISNSNINNKPNTHNDLQNVTKDPFNKNKANICHILEKRKQFENFKIEKSNFKKIIIDICYFNSNSKEEYEIFERKRREFYAQFKGIETISILKRKQEEKKKFPVKTKIQIPEQIRQSSKFISPDLLKCFYGDDYYETNEKKKKKIYEKN